MNYRRIADLDVSGKRLLVRADLNVPLQDGVVTDATRITRFADGMRPLLDKGASLVVLTHFGRPKGRVKPEMSVGQVRDALAKALGRDVDFTPDCIGPEAVSKATALSDGTVLLCENLRFHPQEEDNDPSFAAALAELGDIYVNDAFSCAHRAHASTAALAHLRPAYVGPLMIEELDALQSALEMPKAPSVAIVGGAKVSSKIAVLKNLVSKVDHVIIGGGMANTFLFADGAPMGTSLHEPDQLEIVGEIQDRAAKTGCQLHLPRDVVAATEFAAMAPHKVIPADACPQEMMILDAGPQAVEDFKSVLDRCNTILWNGPLGAFEMDPFDGATCALAQKAADRTKAGAVSVAGGGDTVAALNHAGVGEEFSYVSSAGGAFLEWLEGKDLPGIAALRNDAELV
ncbi:MAG: phosphoglycerate kinase [Pseudomonadota bacterium]